MKEEETGKETGQMKCQKKTKEKIAALYRLYFVRRSCGYGCEFIDGVGRSVLLSKLFVGDSILQSEIYEFEIREGG